MKHYLLASVLFFVTLTTCASYFFLCNIEIHRFNLFCFISSILMVSFSKPTKRNYKDGMDGLNREDVLSGWKVY